MSSRPCLITKWPRNLVWRLDPSASSVAVASTGCRRSWQSWDSKMPQQPNFGVEQWIIDLADLSEESQRREFLAARKDICNRAAVESLYNAVVVFARVDLQKAERMAQASS